MMFHNTLKNKKIHFIGVSGSGMVGICQFLSDLNICKLTGSDLTKSKAVKNLIDKGLIFFNEHKEENIKDADIVIYSGAIPENNIERATAKKLNIKCFHRATFLVNLMQDFKNRISIAGTHGKTTSTGMLIHIFTDAVINPSFCLGGELNIEKVNGKFQSDQTFIVESDESDGTFLEFKPNYTIVTNVECDHMNFFKSEEQLYKNFLKFMKQSVEENGFLALNKDDAWLSSKKKFLKNPNIWTFSTFQKATCEARNITFTEFGGQFDLYYKDNFVDNISLRCFGMHNIYNALGVCCISLKYGIAIKSIKNGLLNFNGVKRRLQFIGNCKGIKIYDDYGHHPTAIKTTLKGLKSSVNSSLICVFQPHRYSRTLELMEDFSKAFEYADKVIITDIFSANETNTNNVTSEHMVNLVKKQNNKTVFYVKDKSDVIPLLSKESKKGDVIVTMGAGDIHSILEPLVEALNK